MANIRMTQKDSIVDQLEQLHQASPVARTTCFGVATAGAMPFGIG